jgi:hypothetical protein
VVKYPVQVSLLHCFWGWGRGGHGAFRLLGSTFSAVSRGPC